MAFRLTSDPIDGASLSGQFRDARAGAFAFFEGRVRDRNGDREVRELEYEAYAPLAEREGERILEEALRKFDVLGVQCVHRTGALRAGDTAVWVGAAAGHRGAAFDACRYVIDETKARLPIWKKEHYADGASEWINCATRGSAAGGPGPA